MLTAFCSWGASGPAAEAFASVCELFPHFSLYSQLTTSPGKPALRAHLGSAAPRRLPAAGNRDSRRCAAFILLGLAASPALSLRLPAQREHAWGKPDAFHSCTPDVLPAALSTGLFAQFDIAMP